MTTAYAIYNANGDIVRQIVCGPANCVIFPLNGEVGVVEQTVNITPPTFWPETGEYTGGSHRVVDGELVENIP